MKKIFLFLGLCLIIYRVFYGNLKYFLKWDTSVMIANNLLTLLFFFVGIILIYLSVEPEKNTKNIGKKHWKNRYYLSIIFFISSCIVLFKPILSMFGPGEIGPGGGLIVFLPIGFLFLGFFLGVIIDIILYLFETIKK